MRTLLRKYLLVVAIAGFVLLLAESFFYEGFLLRYFSITTSQVFWFTLAFIALVRLLTGVSLPIKAFSLLYSFVIPALSLLTVFLNIAPDLFYQNFSFQYFHLHPLPMQVVSTFGLVLLAINLQPQVLRRHSRWSFFVTWIMLLSHLLFFKWKYVGTWFWKMRVEDGPFEYLTALSFFLIGALAVQTIKKLHQLNFKPPQIKKYLLIAFFCMVALGGFVVAGEEISWGQRLLGLNTPEEWAAVNTQDELTLHNHHQILHYVYHAYLLLSAYCTFAWLLAFGLQRIFGRQHFYQQLSPWLELFIPSWHLMPLFIPTLIYTVGRFTVGWTYYGLGAWEETTEMLLSFGLVFYMLDVKNKLQKIVRPWLKATS